jgi:transcriptional regulator with XRE-family HTH domain
MAGMGRAWGPPDVGADDVGADEQVVRVHLKALRREHGLSRAQVARSAGLTRRELRGYERGRVAIPEVDLRSIAGSCGVEVDELLSGAGADAPTHALMADDHGTGWDADWLDTRIDEFLSSDEVDPPYLEIQLMLWDRGSRIWPEPIDPQFPGAVQLTLFDGGRDEPAPGEAVESRPVARRRGERSLREFGRVQVA